jgi:hypothetical protein
MHAALLILANDVSWRTGLVLQARAPGGRCAPGTMRSRWLEAPRTRAGWRHMSGPSTRRATGTLRHNGPSDADRSPRSEPGGR